jgi:hypothetical protein
MLKRLVRRVSDYRHGRTTLCYKDECCKYKLTIDDDKVILRRKTRQPVNEAWYYTVEYVNMYRAYGGFMEDGVFSASPGTEFVMAMLGPCLTALAADTGKKTIVAVVESASYIEVVVESWRTDGLIEPIHFTKYHLKFKLVQDDQSNDSEADEVVVHSSASSRKGSDDSRRRRDS